MKMYKERYSTIPYTPHQQPRRVPRAKGSSRFQQMRMNRLRVHVRAVWYLKRYILHVYRVEIRHARSIISMLIRETTNSNQTTIFSDVFENIMRICCDGTFCRQANKTTRYLAQGWSDSGWSHAIKTLCGADEPSTFRGRAATSTTRRIWWVKTPQSQLTR